MIFFVPGYDPATEANLAIAVGLIGERPALLAGDATREALLQALDHTAEPLFAMAHGRADRLLAQGGTAAFLSADTELLRQRSVFAFACHTAAELGRVAAQTGATWWGYTGAVTSPDAPEELRPLLAEIFVYLSTSFADVDSTDARRSVLLRLRQRCLLAESRIDDRLEADPNLDAGPAYLCLLHLWDRLRIWEAGADSPLLHPEAKPPLLFPAG